jgi:asparagine synthase (glutamine-hydrolysing)
MKNWLREGLRPLMQDLLSPERLKREGLFNPSSVEKLQTEHLQGIANHSHQLWSLMIFEIWRDTYRT